MDKGSIQAVGIGTIGAIVIAAIFAGQMDFATTVGFTGVGAIAGFLGNEALNKNNTDE